MLYAFDVFMPILALPNFLQLFLVFYVVEKSSILCRCFISSNYSSAACNSLMSCYSTGPVDETTHGRWKVSPYQHSSQSHTSVDTACLFWTAR